jgi:hypothetical protein
VVVGPQHGDGGAGLGEPVGVGELDVGQQVHHPLQHGGRRARPAIGQGPQAGQPATAATSAAGALEHVGDARQHRGHDHGVGDAVPAHGPHPAGGVELAQVDEPAPQVEVAQEVGQPGHVVGRHAHEDGLVVARRPVLHGADHVRRQVPVAQHRGLGRGGGAAGVEQDRRVVGLGRDLTGGGAGGAGPGGSHERLGLQHPVPPDGQGARRVALGDHHDVAERDQQVVELVVAEPVVERHERHAGRGRREQPEREGQAVGAHVGQGRCPGGVLGAGPGAGQQLAGGEAVGAGLHHHLVTPPGGGHVEQQEQVHRRDPPSVPAVSPTRAAAWRP